MHCRHRLSLLLLTLTISASFAAVACGDYKGSPLAPGGVGSMSPFTFAVELTQLLRVPAAVSACQFGQGFVVPFNLRLRSDSSSALSLNQVRLQFTDSAGVVGPGLSMRQPELMGQFGSVGIPPLGMREFPLSLPVGCTTRPLGNLSIFVETIDSRGGLSRRTMTHVIR